MMHTKLYTSDPMAGSALMAAARWTQELLLGSVGITIAMLAIAAVGFAMLLGRFSPRSGMKAVLGCFVLFGAPVVAKGLADLARSSSQPVLISPRPRMPESLPRISAPPINSDPYAGASVPM